MDKYEMTVTGTKHTLPFASSSSTTLAISSAGTSGGFGGMLGSVVSDHRGPRFVQWDYGPIPEDSEENDPTPPGPRFQTKRVIFDQKNRATVIYWADGTRTVVRCKEGTEYDKLTGLALCYMKKALRNSKQFFHEALRDEGLRGNKEAEEGEDKSHD